MIDKHLYKEILRAEYFKTGNLLKVKDTMMENYKKALEEVCSCGRQQDNKLIVDLVESLLLCVKETEEEINAAKEH